MNQYMEIVDKIKNADAILIGASNGFSITEGIHLFANNQAFHDLFGDVEKKYGLSCLLQGMSGRWPSEEEKWGFWSRLVNHYCGNYKATDVMNQLKVLINDKDYFIVTSNGERHFELAGFDEEKVYEVEGDWLHMQCENRCHDKVYDSFELLKEMGKAETDGKISTDLVPRCPVCGGTMMVHAAISPSFILDMDKEQQYQDFLRRNHDKKIVILELGIGMRNQLIKAPLMQLAYEEKNVTYVTINLGEIFIPKQIAEKSYGLDGYLDKELQKLSLAYDLSE